MTRHRFVSGVCVHCGLARLPVVWWGQPLLLWRHPRTGRVRHKLRAPWSCAEVRA